MAGPSLYEDSSPPIPAQTDFLLKDKPYEGSGPRLSSRLHLVDQILNNQKVLQKQIHRLKPDFVLFANFSEYLAPLWANGLRKLSSSGVNFSAILHDPVRDYQVGPLWWHRWSIASAFSFLNVVFLHESASVDTVRFFPHQKFVPIPHGPFNYPQPDQSRMEVRESLNIPSRAPLFIIFGHIRDNKNINLALEALSSNSEAHLLVAGSEATAGNKPSGFYQELADSLGVQDHCHWLVQYLPNQFAANLISASDFVLLPYSSTFKSASGVLNLAATYRKPVLASAGEGNLKTKILDYQLGVFVEPDSAISLSEGIKEILSHEVKPDWNSYNRENSWKRNAELISEALTTYT